MALRKASAYTKRKARPYTRKSSVKSKSYIKTIPPQKVVKFQMGNIRAFDSGKFNRILKLISEEKVQIRDNALESARQYIHNKLEANFLGQYYFAVKVFPHHILRENKMIAGAGADRMQTGMQLSFGKTMGRAALVKEGQEIFLVAVDNDKVLKFAREVIGKIKAKLPCRTAILSEKK